MLHDANGLPSPVVSWSNITYTVIYQGDDLNSSVKWLLFLEESIFILNIKWYIERFAKHNPRIWKHSAHPYDQAGRARFQTLDSKIEQPINNVDNITCPSTLKRMIVRATIKNNLPVSLCKIAFSISLCALKEESKQCSAEKVCLNCNVRTFA